MEGAVKGDSFDEWLDSLPPHVAATYRRYAGHKFILEGVRHYLIGVTEIIGTNDAKATGLWLSTIDPEKDYDGAVASKIYVCACCLERLHSLIPPLP